MLHSYEICPDCNRKRRTLAVYDNNVKCHACGYYSKTHELLDTHLTPANNSGTPTMNLTLPNLFPFEWTSKGIPAKVLDLYGVGVTNDGLIVIPHYSPNMELLAYSTRHNGLRDFRMHGHNVPIGLHTLGKNTELIICEGQSDTLAGKTMFPRCDVIGIPGSDTAKSLLPYMSHMRKYKRITIMMDGDDAGRKATTDLMDMLPRSKTFVTQLSEGLDVGDYLVRSRVDELTNQYTLATSNKVSPFVTDEDCDRYANSPLYESISTGIQGLDSMLGGGLNVADLTLLTGYTGKGKSAITQQLAVNIAKSGTKVLYVAGEMTPKQNLDRLVRQWYGGIIRKEDLAKCYKTVASQILITKFSELSISNVVDVVHEAVLDQGARVVIVDVLSDIDGFLSTDMTHPAKIMDKLYRACKGDDINEVPPCAMLCVAHTKGNDEGRVKADDIRGGSAIRQVAGGGIIGFSEEEPGNLRNPNRVLHLEKRPRNRDHSPDDVTVTFDAHSQRYTEVQHASTSQDTNQGDVRLTPRREVSQQSPSPSVPPRRHIHVGTEEETVSTRGTTEDGNASAIHPANGTSEPVSPGLLLSTDTTVHRDEGDITERGQTEVQASSRYEPGNTIQVSNSVNETTEYVGVTESTGVTQSSSPDERLNALRNMYDKHPNILKQHLTTTHKTNNTVRTHLIALGYQVE